MKTIIKLFVLIAVVTLLFSSKPPQTPPNPKIGTFELYRDIEPNDIVAYFGEPSETSNHTSDDENGATIDSKVYRYNNNFSLAIYELPKRVELFGIRIRDEKYAINGILMVGDSLIKVHELGYEVSSDNYTLSKNYVVLYLPTYKKGNSSYYYYLKVSYDKKRIIKQIQMFEETGV
ncbi:MAG: hypothetical protein ACRDDZ_12805 [Marinifilaceae bacterium]